MNSQLTLNAISSPVSEAGHSPCASPDGPTINPCGQVPAHASRLALLDKELENLTKDTCGRTSETSSASANLQSSLESRLRAQMDVNGSPEYRLTWKHWPIGSRRQICALRASERRIGDNACSGWRTPTSGDAIRGVENNPKLRNPKAGTASLNNEAALVGWPTPNVPNGGRQPKGGMSSTGVTLDGKKRQVGTEQIAKLVGWCSPMGQDGTRGSLPPRPQDTGIPLSQQAALAGWCSPASRDWKDSPGMATIGTNPDGSTRNRIEMLPRQAAQALGTDSTCSHSETEKPGALRPGHSRWLMGFPDVWDSCGATAMQSCHKLPRNSSKRGARQYSANVPAQRPPATDI